MLRQHGWISVGAIGDKTSWKRPNKREVGISATSNYANSGLFHVFSTNAFPFEAQRLDAPFAVYAWLEHGGNFQAAARALREQEYGDDSANGHSQVKRAGSQLRPAGVQFASSPQPLRMRLRPVPPLPPEIIPRPFRPWLQDIAERMSCPLEYPTVAAIIAVAAIVGRKCGIKPKQFDNWPVIPNIWGGIVGPPGVQKTPATDEAMKALKYLVAQAIKKYEAEMTVYERDVEAAKRSDGGILPSKPICKRYIVNDPTVEALGERLKENPNGLLIHRDELMGFLRSMERPGREGDRTFFLELWNGNGQFVFDRIGRGTVIVPHLCGSIFGTIQPGPLAEYIHKSGGGIGADGFIQRFQLLVYPDVPAWRHVDRSPNWEARKCADDVFERLDQLDAQSLGASMDEELSVPFFQFAPDAQQFFTEWWSDLENNKIRGGNNSPAVEAHLAKYRSLMPSLALLFHLIECVSPQGESQRGPVSLTAAKYAAAWCDFLELHMHRIYGGAAEDEKMKRAIALKDHLASWGEDSLRVPSIVQKGWKGLDATNAVNDALVVLEEHGWVKVVEVATGGRPSRLVRLHPQISEGQ